MGHTISVYHDIEMKGVEFLRNIYASSGLAIKPKTRVNKIDAIKEIIRAWGLEPEKILTREALTQGATTYVNPENLENHHLQILTRSIERSRIEASYLLLFFPPSLGVFVRLHP